MKPLLVPLPENLLGSQLKCYTTTFLLRYNSKQIRKISNQFNSSFGLSHLLWTVCTHSRGNQSYAFVPLAAVHTRGFFKAFFKLFPTLPFSNKHFELIDISFYFKMQRKTVMNKNVNCISDGVFHSFFSQEHFLNFPPEFKYISSAFSSSFFF